MDYKKEAAGIIRRFGKEVDEEAKERLKDFIEVELKRTHELHTLISFTDNLLFSEKQVISMNDIDMIMGDIKYILKVDNHKEYYLQIIQEVFENLNYFNYQNHFFYIKKNDLINLFKKRLIKKYQNIKNQIISQKFNLSKIYTTINDVVYYIFKCNIQKK